MSQQNVQAGRDVVTQFLNVIFNAPPAPSDGNAGRIRDVTASVRKLPIDADLWAVSVNNGTHGPIHNLAVNVYSINPWGIRSDGCVPAKHRISLVEMFRKLAVQRLPGMLEGITDNGQMNPWAAPGISSGAIGGFGGELANYLASSPQLVGALQGAQAAMLDSFPQQLAAGQREQVAYVLEGGGTVEVDIEFDDEDGNRWCLPYDKPPRLMR